MHLEATWTEALVSHRTTSSRNGSLFATESVFLKKIKLVCITTLGWEVGIQTKYLKLVVTWTTEEKNQDDCGLPSLSGSNYEVLVKH